MWEDRLLRFVFETVPDGDDVGEKHNKSKEIAEPRTHKPLQCNHHHRENHLGQEQGFGETVQLQVQQANLWGKDRRQNGPITT